MKSARRFLLCLLTGSALLAASCKTTPETADANHPATTDKKKPPVTNMPDQNGDQSFQAFLSRLRQAVHAHDVETIASMMTEDFGYRIEPLGEGKGVFEYWDENNVWPELELIIKERFVPNGDKYMVAPVDFVTNPDHYAGYRAGLRLVNGSWKFAYFVTG